MRKFGVAVNYITPITLCMLISIGFVRLFVSSGLVRSIPKALAGSLIEQLVWTLGLTIIGLIGVSCFYWLIIRRRNFEVRVLLAIVVAPTSAILLIVLSQTILMVVAKMVSALMASLVVLASLYLAIFSVIFILSDVFSNKVRNLIFILYGSLLGSFVSLLIPSISLVILLFAVALYDLLIFNSQRVMAIIRDLSLSKGIVSRFSYIGDNVDIGIGEFIFYSFIPAHVEAYYGIELLILTLLMTTIGVLFNLWILTKKEFLAGLPAPIFLGLVPLIFKIVF